MKTAKILLLILFNLSQITACKTSSQIFSPDKINSFNNVNQLVNFYPLNTGRTWNYKLEQLQNDVPNTKFKEMTISVVNNETKSGTSTALIKRFYPNSTIQPNQTLATIYPDHIDLSRYVQQSVFESLGSNFNMKGINFITILKLPLEIGESWDGRIFQGGSEKIQINGKENITVPAGIFNALKVQHHLTYDNGQEDNLYYWYAEGTGTVKMHEEITFNLSGQWVKFKSIGVLKGFSDK